MYKFLIGFLLSMLLSLNSTAETLTLTGPATVKQGKTFSVNVNLSGATATSPSAVQWSLGFPTEAALTSNSSQVLGKSLLCSNSSPSICVLYGINTSVIANGAVATHDFTVAQNAPTGVKSFSLSNLAGVTGAGAAVTVNSGPIYNITITALADINNDGLINATDVSLIANQVINQSCTDDQNGDGRCDIVDIYLVVLRALGV